MGHLMRACPVVQQNRTASCKQKAEKRLPDGARRCQMVPESARGCQRVPDGANRCQMVPEGGRGARRTK